MCLKVDRPRTFSEVVSGGFFIEDTGVKSLEKFLSSGSLEWPQPKFEHVANPFI